jgi:signal transduction histidine kinase
MSSVSVPPQTKKVRRIELVEMLNEVALVANEHADVQEVLERSLDIVVRRLEMEAGTIFLWEKGELVLKVRHGLSEAHAREVDRRRSRSEDSDLANLAVQNQKVFFVEDMAQSTLFDVLWEVKDKRSLLQIPLIASEGTRGVMGLVTKAGEPLSKPEAELLGAVGHQIGLIVENAELLAEAVRCETEAKLLLTLGTQISTSLELDEVLGAIAESGCTLLEMDHGMVALMEESGKEMIIRTASGPLKGTMQRMKIFQGQGIRGDGQILRQPILCEGGHLKPAGVWDLKEILSLGVHSLLAVPFLRGDRILGMLAVMGDTPHSFSERDIQLLQQLAQRVVVAIENAMLYQQVRSMTAIEERRWLARELHDDLAQGVGLINIQTTITEDLLSRGEVDQAKESLKQVKEIANRTYTDVREAIFSLRTVVAPDKEFLMTLQDYLSDYQRHYSVKTSLRVKDEIAVRFSDDVGAQVAYIIKEAITNARKHGGAQSVEVSIVGDESRSRITVKDDGIGFDPLNVSGEDAQQTGLQIMRERARSVKGDLEVQSNVGKGTSVTLCVPIDQTKQGQS